MSGRFVSASSQYIKNAAPPSLASTGYPMTMACWLYIISATSSNVAIGYFDTATTGASGHRFNLEVNSTPKVGLTARQGATANQSTFTTAVGATGTWIFAVGRFISATNRRLAVLYGGGASDHSQGVTSVSPAGMDAMGVGGMVDSTPNTFFDGLIGEFWYTDTDIVAGGGAMDDSLLRQLAYGGPFSMPHIVKDIVEYRSFRTAITSDMDNGGEIFSRFAPQTWTQSGSPTLGAHPPLLSPYKRPRNINGMQSMMERLWVPPSTVLARSAAYSY